MVLSDFAQQHSGESWGQRTPEGISGLGLYSPEFVCDQQKLGIVSWDVQTSQALNDLKKKKGYLGYIKSKLMCKNLNLAPDGFLN